MTEYQSRVYTDRPDYADYDPPEKFEAITGIIMTRLCQHPNAICSYSGGADSDIMIHLIENARKMVSLPPVKYVFFNTGLEMKATKDHVKATAKKIRSGNHRGKAKSQYRAGRKEIRSPIRIKDYVSRIVGVAKEGSPALNR